ncbi:Fic family protein [Capnocytophaga canimorsus]|uniref:Fic family protein n=1 Tax=Capnocytophaga canimorsus TaxID=28188 RepID=UPI001EDE2B26|nr:Fic family protein [Capnocytophaga canimorsus]GJQ04870.1 cell filamentation protein Fic [Capnocytophaga canimorsus]
MKTEDLLSEFRNLEIQQNLNYEQFNKIFITSHSTRIEGSTLTLEESMELIQSGNTPGGKHILFSNQTIDHYNALNFILKEADNGRTISKEFIQEIGALVMKNTGEVFTNINGTVDASKGEFRKTGVVAGSVSFMNYTKIIPAVEKLVKELNENIPLQKDIYTQLELSFYAHYQLVNIHPFLDGNGRTSRLLMNFIQQKYQLPLGVIFAEDKDRYYEALNSVRSTENFSLYNEFMFSQYEKYLQMEIDRQKRKVGNK